MSNLIKYPFVNLDGKEAFVIKTDESDDFVPFHKEKEQPSDEIQPKDEMYIAAEEENEPGLFNADLILEQERERCQREAQVILEDARKTAKELVTAAESEADSIREEAFATAKQDGFTKGEAEAREEYQRKMQELEEKIRNHETEYAQLLDEIEPKYVEVLISLVKKLTGVIVEEHSDIILYLIQNSVRNLDKSNRYVLRISSEDSFLVESQKNLWKDIMGEEASLEIVEEKDLKKNECIIETDSQMVECGFHTQMTNLLEALKLLVQR